MDSVDQAAFGESLNGELKDANMANSELISVCGSGMGGSMGVPSSSSSAVSGVSCTMGSNVFDLGDSKALGDESIKSLGDSMMDSDFPEPVDDEEVKRSIYVGNVDYGTKLSDLQDLFKNCGSINRITIINDKKTGMPKGFAYLEFCETEAVETALKFDGALFRGRQIKVSTKRRNIPGYNRARGLGPGGGFRARGGHRGYSRGGGGVVQGHGANIRGHHGSSYKSHRGGGGVGGFPGNRHLVNPY
ncbi:Sgn1p-like RRM domain-containing protein [Cryptosporidium canis]|uniref:Sgn1p-like RRM domain-containing protein n=1 Tax=Cryptosporidium canis TaxID=195482 RepID=A0ABQ8P8X7_9CRYT|nr:Sgn1p-like RRM domain-containing protein [Cryptosporidium canis]KAJ1612770.1 Sgn1p-like RRM domain-containing protein [Cryptosporidium canis]